MQNLLLLAKKVFDWQIEKDPKWIANLSLSLIDRFSSMQVCLDVITTHTTHSEALVVRDTGYDDKRPRLQRRDLVRTKSGRSLAKVAKPQAVPTP